MRVAESANGIVLVLGVLVVTSRHSPLSSSLVKYGNRGEARVDLSSLLGTGASTCVYTTGAGVEATTHWGVQAGMQTGTH